jgi:iron complex transport system permease protein
MVTEPRHRYLIFSGFFLFLVGSFAVSLAMGASDIGILESWWIALKQLAGRVPDNPSVEEMIIVEIRFPRIVLAGLVGASLALAGCICQALLRNPLAEPYVLGVSSGAAVGALFAIIIGLSDLPFGELLVPVSSFAGAVVAILLVYNVARINGVRSTHHLLLTGVIFAFFFSAMVMLLTAIAPPEKMQSVIFWLMGDLSSPEKIYLIFLGCCFLFSAFIGIFFAREMNVLVLGEEPSHQLGIEVERNRLFLFLAATLVVGAAVAVSGSIGFVGLIIPHMTRLMVGADHRTLIPSTILFGAGFLILADTAARTVIRPAEIPVGVITSLCGAPFFLYLLRRRKTIYNP